MYLTPNSATHLYEDFVKKHRMPYQKPLDPSKIIRLFAKITPSEIDRFLTKLNKLIVKDEEEKSN